MVSDKAQRLEAYKAAELRALQAQRIGHGDQSRENAQLAELRRAIRELELELAGEARGNIGPAVMVADFSGRLGDG